MTSPTLRNLLFVARVSVGFTLVILLLIREDKPAKVVELPTKDVGYWRKAG